MADAGILARLAALGIIGARATNLANSMDVGQVAAATDAQLWVMISGRESGDDVTVDPLYPDGHLYPS